MSETLSKLATTSLPVLLPLLFAAAIAALVPLTRWLHQKGASSKRWEVLACASEVMLAIVRDLNVSVKPGMLEASGGGLSKGQAAQLKAAALDSFKRTMGAAGVKQLEKALGVVAGGVGVYLSGLVEGAVERNKNTQRAHGGAQIGRAHV